MEPSEQGTGLCVCHVLADLWGGMSRAELAVRHGDNGETRDSSVPTPGRCLASPELTFPKPLCLQAGEVTPSGDGWL